MAFLLISLLYSLLGSLCVQQRSLKVEYIQCHWYAWQYVSLFLFSFCSYCKIFTNIFWINIHVIWTSNTHLYFVLINFFFGIVFYFAGRFNSDLSKWDTKRVTTMHASTSLSFSALFSVYMYMCLFLVVLLQH